MPAKDIYHDNAKQALIKDGWTITHDPLKLKWGAKDLYVDLGAMQLLGAEKQERKIAIEIKSFVGKSDLSDLQKALGQYIMYHDILTVRDPQRTIYLAIPHTTYQDLFTEPIGTLLLNNNRLKLIAFDPHQEVIVTWKPPL